MAAGTRRPGRRVTISETGVDVRVPNIGLQRTSACGLAAEAGSLGSLRTVLAFAALLLSPATLFSSSFRGQVTDAFGAPLQGVTVQVQAGAECPEYISLTA